MVTLTMSESSPSKMVHIAIPGSGSGYTSPRTESISAKMKKILTSPKGNRGKSEPTPYKTFGVLLEYLFERDKCEVPLIVSRLCEYLKQNGMRQEGLFRVNGNIKVVDRLKTLFDKNGEADLEDIGDVPACASLLKMFLRELTDPVIPDDLQPLFINLQHKYCQDKPNLVPRVKQLVTRMPSLNVDLLKYLCEFMLYISCSSDGNKMTPLALAIVFGPNIFRCGEGLNGLRDQAYVNAVLLLMLQEFAEIFGIKDNEINSKEPPQRPLSYLDHVKKKQEKNSDENTIPGPPQVHLDEKTNKIIQTPSPEKREGTDSKSPLVHKSRPMSQVKNNKSPSISLSPTHSVTSSSTKQSKQLVENTINIAVKELLFGPGMVTSSCESERHDEAKNDESVENVYRSVKDQIKNYPFEMTEETLNEGLICQTRRTKSCHGKKERRNVYERCMSSPPEQSKAKHEKHEITDEDLEFIGGVSGETLRRLTSSRVQPPQNRRKPSFRGRSKEKPCCGKNVDNVDNTENKLKDSLTNNVNKEIVYSRYDNEMNLNVKNIDNVSRNIPKNTHENDSKVTTHKDRGNDHVQSSSSSKNNQGHNVASPLPHSSPVTPVRKLSSNTQHTSLSNNVIPADVRHLQDRSEVGSVSPQGKHVVPHDEPYRSPHLSSPSSPEKWMEKRQDALPVGEMSPPTLKRRIISLKKVISNLEANFEETNGRKPKPSEKGQIQKYMVELGRAKKQLKEVLADHRGRDELSPESTPTIHGYSNASSGIDESGRDELSAKEETLSLLLKKLEDKRLDSRRPEDILAMSSNQLKDEKLAVQKALLMYENQHGRPTSKEDKTLMRPLYDRYRKIKRLIATGKPEPLRKESGGDQIQPTYNGQNSQLGREESVEEAARNEINTRVSHFPNNVVHKNTYDGRDPYDGHDRTAHVDFDNLGEETCETFMVTNRLHETPEMSSVTSPGYGASRASDDAILHDATIGELVEQQRLTKRTKKRLGKLLKDFEEDFFNQHNRKVQKNDRLPKQAEYREYKLIKAKLRLVEALIEKKRGSAHSQGS